MSKFFSFPDISSLPPQILVNSVQFKEEKPLNTNSSQLLKFLVLENFKIHPCPIKSVHLHKQCQYYHYPKDRKRTGDFYSADLCEYIERNQSCPFKDLCLSCHSCVEQLYRKDKYKMKFCSHYPNDLNNCEYGEFCSFAHQEDELMIDLLHRLEKDDNFFIFQFKTIMCPFHTFKHDKAQCVYAHNWQDFRRRPSIYQYSPELCPHWKFQNFIINYNNACPNGVSCNKCHGWKEFDYHPLVFKTKPCLNGKNCHRIFECPLFHSNSEQRMIEHNIKNGIFKFASKNIYACEKTKNDNEDLETQDDLSEQNLILKSSYISKDEIPINNPIFGKIMMSSLDLEAPKKKNNFNSEPKIDNEGSNKEFDQISASLNEIYLGCSVKRNSLQ